MVGIIKRVPRELVEEMERLKAIENTKREVDVFKDIAKNSRMIDEFRKFDFFYPMKRRKR